MLAAGAVRPLAGAYDVVFDSATAAGAARFTFRFWFDDTQPPTLGLTGSRPPHGLLVVRAKDRLGRRSRT